MLPILEQRCLSCHRGIGDDGRARRPKAGLRLDGSGWIRRGSDRGPVLVPGDADGSTLYSRTILPADDPDRMPARGAPLSREQTEVLRRWIAAGADFGGWTGQPGPTAGELAPAAAAPEAGGVGSRSSTATTPTAVALLEELGRSLAPPSAAALQQARAAGLRVVAAQPASPLLEVDAFAHEDRIGDAEVAALLPLAAHVSAVSLRGTQITDAAAAVLARMPRLTRLDLSGTAITDRGLRALRSLAELRVLVVHSTAVSDAAVAALAELPQLRAVYLWNTGVSEAGAAELRAKRPRCAVYHRLVLPEVPGPRPGATRRRR